jgi:hypothetical protein
MIEEGERTRDYVYMERPLSKIEAAVNLQLSLLKLRDLKDHMRNRYRYSRFSQGGGGGGNDLKLPPIL